MSSLKDKEIFIDETGNMSMGKVDPNTGQLDPQSVESFRSMALPSNMVFDKVPLDETVNDTVKFWKPYIEELGLTTIESVKKNPDMARKMADLTGGLTSNPRLTASILVDNTGEGYDVYFGREDFNNKMGEMIQIENEARRIAGERPMNQAEQNEFATEASGKLIEMRKDATDTYQPVITDDQLSRAKEAIEVAVSLQLGVKSVEDETRIPYRGAGGNSGNGGNTNNNKKYDSKTMDEIRSIVASPNWSKLQQYSTGGKYTFKPGANNTIDVYQKNARGEDELVTNTTFYNAGQFFKGFSNPDEWKKYVDYSQSKGKGNTSKFNG
jgi:hypothetical protein